MNRTTLFSIGSALVAVVVMSVAGYGCGDDDVAATNKADTGTTPKPDGSTTTPDGGSEGNAPPTLGAQIDRMGRPAVNTALNNTFEAVEATAGTAKDGWNANATPSGWSAAYAEEVSKNLAIYDGLDRNCSNQPLSDQDAGAVTSKAKYGALGGVLADDRLWLNTAGTTAAQYLAVELNATKLVVNTDRGGRTLPMDVIDTTFTALVDGLDPVISDGIAADPAKTGGTTFPYLAPPK